MLNKVPQEVNTFTRNVVINHPNSFKCEMYRKKILRKDPHESPGVIAGDPTWGGMGQLDDADEEDYIYEYQGDGYGLLLENFVPAPMVDHNDATIGASPEFRFLIIPAAENSGEEGFFNVSTHDLMMWLIEFGEDTARLAFEVVGRETTMDIPPYCVRYICNRRDDLHMDVNGNFFNQRELKKAQKEYQEQLQNSEK